GRQGRRTPARTPGRGWRRCYSPGQTRSWRIPWFRRTCRLLVTAASPVRITHSGAGPRETKIFACFDVGDTFIISHVRLLRPNPTHGRREEVAMQEPERVVPHRLQVVLVDRFGDVAVVALYLPRVRYHDTRALGRRTVKDEDVMVPVPPAARRAPVDRDVPHVRSYEAATLRKVQYVLSDAVLALQLQLVGEDTGVLHKLNDGILKRHVDRVLVGRLDTRTAEQEDDLRGKFFNLHAEPPEWPWLHPSGG